MKYTQTIFFYLDDEELKDLDEKAVLAGITRSEYVRSRINETVMLPTVNIDYGQQGLGCPDVQKSYLGHRNTYDKNQKRINKGD